MIKIIRALRTPRGVAWLGGTVLVAIVAGLALFNVRMFSDGTPPMSAMAPTPGTSAAFTYLAAQHSNFCQLQQSTVMGYSDDQRLQGACCNALDMTKYQWQVRGLHAYTATNPDIAPDPYDIQVSLAKRLFGYDASITLTAAQQHVYDTAISMTADKAPCCCQCWRWYMTRGLAKSLIAQRGTDAASVAHVIDLGNGCGGAMDSSASSRPVMSMPPGP